MSEVVASGPQESQHATSAGDLASGSEGPQIFGVVYEDESMIVIDKPPNVAMDTPKGETSSQGHRLTVESWAYDYMKVRGLFDETHASLQASGQRRKQLKFVHQLDYSTSGLLCLAFTKPKAAALAHCFELRRCVKWYLAVLEGHVSRSRVTSVRAAWVEPRGRGDTDTEDAESGVFPCPDWRVACPDTYHMLAAEVAALSDQAEGKNLPRFLHVFEQDRRNGHDTSHDVDMGDVRQSRQDMPSTGSSTAFVNTAKQLLQTLPCLKVVLPVGKDTSDPDGFRMGVPGLRTAPQQAAQPPSTDGETGSEVVQDARYAATFAHVLEEGFLTHPQTKEMWPVTKVLLRPIAGRRHQLRVHCAMGLGCPILGDVAYGTHALRRTGATADKDGGVASSLLTAPAATWPRMYLHAWRLAFPENLLGKGSLDEISRVENKKKRRREIKGLEEKPSSDQTDCWTVFHAADPFPHLDRCKSDTVAE